MICCGAYPKLHLLILLCVRVSRLVVVVVVVVCLIYTCSFHLHLLLLC